MNEKKYLEQLKLVISEFKQSTDNATIGAMANEICFLRNSNETLVGKKNKIEIRSAISHKIIRQFYIAAENLGASSELLALFGSYGDTLDDEDILQLLRDYNETGTYIKKVYISINDTPQIRRERFRILKNE